MNLINSEKKTALCVYSSYLCGDKSYIPKYKLIQ